MKDAERFDNFLNVNLEEGEVLGGRFLELMEMFGVKHGLEAKGENLELVRNFVKEAFGPIPVKNAFLLLFRDESLGVIIHVKGKGEEIASMTYIPLVKD